MSAPESIVARLAAVIESRKRLRPSGSYTVELLDAGHAAISARVIEEAYELIAAGGDDSAHDRGAIVHEAADVVYHLLVFLAACDCDWSDVERELTQRFGIGGLEAQAARAKDPP
jgi:phosphoribosyl-ATP pyrophosphohydrolase